MMAKSRAPSGSDNGRLRQALYRAATEHVQRSIRDGFFLEAITLCESMISDRIEALVAALDPEHPVAGRLLALGTNLQHFRRVLQDDTEGQTLALRIDAWRRVRNEALHEMVKLPEGDAGDWDARRAGLAAVAREGRDLARLLSALVRRKRRAAGDRVAKGA